MWSPSRPSNSQPQPAAEPAASRSVAPVASRQYNEGSTYIGKSLVIKGELTGSEPVHIEGRIEGPISLRECHVNIGRDAVVNSNVEAGDIVVRGTLHGNVKVIDRVEVHSGGSMTGNVAAGRVSIEVGAFFKGSVDMNRPDPKPHFESSAKAEPKPNALDESRSPVLTY